MRQKNKKFLIMAGLFFVIIIFIGGPKIVYGAASTEDFDPTNVTAVYDSSLDCVKVTWLNPNVNYLSGAHIFQSTGPDFLGKEVKSMALSQNDANQPASVCVKTSTRKSYYVVRLETVDGTYSTNSDQYKVTIPLEEFNYTPKIYKEDEGAGIYYPGDGVKLKNGLTVFCKDGNIEKGEATLEIVGPDDTILYTLPDFIKRTYVTKGMWRPPEKSPYNFHIYTTMPRSYSKDPTVPCIYMLPYSLASPVDSNFVYPKNTLVRKIGEPTVYIIKNGIKKPVATPKIFNENNYQWDKVIEADEKNLPDTISRSSPMLYEDGKILKDSKGNIYFIENGTKRRIAGPNTLKKFGFKKIILVEEEIISAYLEGSILTSSDSYPDGVLLKLSDGSAVYYKEEGKLRPIYSDKVFKTYHFNWDEIINVPQQELNKYVKSSLLLFGSGTLIKAIDKPSVYLIDDNEKLRPIVSGQVFERLHYRWSDIYDVPSEVVDQYEKGKAIE